MDCWFAFKAYNSETMYGYGDPQEADLFVDELNATGLKHYAAYPLTTAQATELKLNDEKSDLGFSLTLLNHDD